MAATTEQELKKLGAATRALGMKVGVADRVQNVQHAEHEKSVWTMCKNE
jgi:hypothetical protein